VAAATNYPKREQLINKISSKQRLLLLLIKSARQQTLPINIKMNTINAPTTQQEDPTPSSPLPSETDGNLTSKGK